MFQFIGRLAQNLRFWSGIMNYLIHEVGSRADFEAAQNLYRIQKATLDGQIDQAEWVEIGHDLGILD